MKTFGTGTIRNIAEEFTSKALLVIMAKISIGFFTAYMAAALCVYIITATTFFTCSYAQKRIVHRIVHQRKFALFPGYAKKYVYKKSQPAAGKDF